mgnify:CR=1 FL=1
MAIEKKNKFAETIKELEKAETNATQKSTKVLNKIAGSDSQKTKLIQDKNGRVREIKIKEPRKAFQVYLPESIFQKLNTVLDENGKSRNGLIEELIREYLSQY